MPDAGPPARTVTWRPLSEWKRSPYLGEVMLAFPCINDPRYWSVSVICDPDIYIDGLSADETRDGMWTLVPYPFPQPEAAR